MAKNCQSGSAYACSSLAVWVHYERNCRFDLVCIKAESRYPTLRPDAEGLQRPLSVSAPCTFMEFCFPRAGPTLNSLFTLTRTALRSTPACPSPPTSSLAPHRTVHGLGRLDTCRVTSRNLLAQTDPALMPAKELREHF